MIVFAVLGDGSVLFLPPTALSPLLQSLQGLYCLWNMSRAFGCQKKISSFFVAGGRAQLGSASWF